MIHFIAVNKDKIINRKQLSSLITLSNKIVNDNFSARNKFRKEEDKLFNIDDYFLLNYTEDKLSEKRDASKFLNNKDFLKFTTIPFFIGEKTADQTKTYIARLKKMWNKLNCEECSENEIVYRHAMPTGNIDASFMFIGEAPGVADGAKSFERAMGYGRTSNFLRQSLNHIGILEYSWFTNILKCSLIDNQKQSNEPFEKCWKNLITEIECINPKKIFVLGKNAQNFLKNKLPTQFIKIYHPSFCLYSGIDYKAYSAIVERKLND